MTDKKIKKKEEREEKLRLLNKYYIIPNSFLGILSLFGFPFSVIMFILTSGEIYLKLFGCSFVLFLFCCTIGKILKLVEEDYKNDYGSN